MNERPLQEAVAGLRADLRAAFERDREIEAETDALILEMSESIGRLAESVRQLSDAVGVIDGAVVESRGSRTASCLPLGRARLSSRDRRREVPPNGLRSKRSDEPV